MFQGKKKAVYPLISQKIWHSQEAKKKKRTPFNFSSTINYFRQLGQFSRYQQKLCVIVIDGQYNA